ncbi:MAG: hypothetical protein EBX35_02225 [Planctomycetia bacterium]|nr:hypothetical protein [Planctomycetia bacterium]
MISNIRSTASRTASSSRRSGLAGRRRAGCGNSTSPSGPRAVGSVVVVAGGSFTTVSSAAADHRPRFAASYRAATVAAGYHGPRHARCTITAALPLARSFPDRGDLRLGGKDPVRPRHLRLTRGAAALAGHRRRGGLARRLVGTTRPRHHHPGRDRPDRSARPREHPALHPCRAAPGNRGSRRDRAGRGGGGAHGARAGARRRLVQHDLFRVFDILKPPPIRQTERLPEGLGIMADDQVAAGFAAAGLAALRWQGWL